VGDSLRRQELYYSFGQFANGVYNGVNNAILGLYVSAFTGNPFIIGYVSNTRTVEGAILQPIVGRWSDRTTSPLGRRRPFILAGIPLAVFFLALVPLFGHSDRHVALPLIIGSIVLFSICWNVAGDPYQALMVDIIPPARRSVYNGILSVIALFGQVAIGLYASLASVNKSNIPDGVFYLCVLVLFVCYAAVFFGVREPEEAGAQASREDRIPLHLYLGEMRGFGEANKLLISIFFLWTGLNAIIPFLTVFTKKVMHVGDSKAILVYLTVIAASGACAYPFGRLGSRYGNRRFILLGTALMVVAAIGGIIAPTYSSLFPVAILAGCGFAATTALTYPYLAELVPGSKIGVFTGLQASFSSIAVPLSTGITAGLIHFYGYRSIFAMQAVMMVLDIAVLLTVDDQAARKQVRAAELAEAALLAAAPSPGSA